MFIWGFGVFFKKQDSVFQTALKPPVDNLFVTPHQRLLNPFPRATKKSALISALRGSTGPEYFSVEIKQTK